MPRKPHCELTTEERKAAERLKSIWLAKKEDLGISQEKVSLAASWTPSAFGQCLHAHIPLNTEAMLKLAGISKVSPNDIFPEKMAEVLAAESTAGPIDSLAPVPTRAASP
ncbi:MAG: hypothetical protein JMN24_17770 [gamma proteobacterium endosymbiont of Lamellibrachia anaximandri]|nr:hypothetical protein [gamma proteobacterium endosymbiont of Lamellibrachia anaximandri]MBL3619331.1 hypothetical protein [gamma proteobacterium endosymbiont of Lamellibrachia anaximandri]